MSRLSSSIQAAHHFLLSEQEARSVCDEQQRVIEKNWEAVCDEAELSEIDRKLLWRKQFLNPYCFM